jgi:uncharacterized protein
MDLRTPTTTPAIRVTTSGSLWRIGRWPLIGYLVLLLVMMSLENSLIFIPLNFHEDDWQPQGLGVEDARFEASDGTKLHGWFAPHPHPRAVVLFCHGNAGNITHRADVIRKLRERTGVSVLVFDYRGYGRSEGKPSEAGVLADARAARAWLARRTGLPEPQIVVMGESLGGAVAVDLAAGEGARALVLEGTFTSLPDAAAYHYPWLPVRWLMRTRLDSVSKIGRYQGPLFQAHAEKDTIIPIELGRRLFDAAIQARPKEFKVLTGQDHNDSRPESYYDALGEFLGQLPAP